MAALSFELSALVTGLNRQLSASTQNRLDLRTPAVCGLYDRYGIVDVSTGLALAADAGFELACNGGASHIVGGSIDTVAGAEPFHGFGLTGHGASHTLQRSVTLQNLADAKHTLSRSPCEPIVRSTTGNRRKNTKLEREFSKISKNVGETSYPAEA